MSDHTIRLTVNGRPREGRAEARLTLVDFLRETLGLTGTHVGCVVGECGACSVHLDGALVKSCLVLAVQAQPAPDTVPWNDRGYEWGAFVAHPVEVL